MLKTISQKIIDNIFNILIIIGILILFTQSCHRNSIIEKPTISIVRDTIWTGHDTTIYLGNTIQPIKKIRDTIEINSVEYRPSDNYDSLLYQFNSIKETLLTKNIYSNELRYDSSSVVITDTLEKNKLIGRSAKFSLKYPTITNTITINNPPIKKRILYIGGGVEGNKDKIFNSVEIGLLYKDKKDHILGIGISSDFSNHINYGLKAYFPIKLKK